MAADEWQDIPAPNQASDWQDIPAPGQMTGAAREIALPLSNLAAGAVGLSLVPKAIGDLENKYITTPLFGEADKTAAPNPGMTQVIQPLTNAGIINRPDLQPQNARERYEAAAAKGVGSTLPFLATGGNPAMLLASGAGSGAGQQAGEDMGLGAWGQFFTSMAGGLGVGGLTGVTQRAFNRANGNLSSIAQAYKDVGVQPTLAGNATDSPTLKWMQNVATELPVSSDKIQDLSEQEMQNFGKAANNFASRFGSSQTMQDAGEALQKGGKDWLDAFKENSGKAWNAVDDAVGKNTPANLSNTENIVASIKNQAPKNPQLQAFLGSKLANDVDGIISEAKGNFKPASFNEEGLVVPSSGNPASPITWNNLQKLRSRIGEYLSNPDLIADAGTAQAKQIYGALSQDMKNTALTSGNPQALPLFDAANTLTKNGHDFVDNVLSGITGKGISPENAAQSALSSNKLGGSKLAALRQEMPDSTDELAAAKIRMAAQSMPSAQNAAGTRISPSRFLTELGDGGKMSPEAMSALIPEPDDKAVLDSLNKVAGSVRKTESLANNSKTGSRAILPLMGVGAFEGAKTGHALAGIPGAIGGAFVGGASPLAIGVPFSKITTNPLLINLMSGAPGANVPSYPALAALAAIQQQHK